MKIYEITTEQFKKSNTLLNKALQGFDLSSFVNQKPAATIENNIGHVWLTGMLINNATPIEKQLGATDYKDFIKELESHITANVDAIVIHANSGGGTCEGAVEAANAVANCPVPIIATIDGQACSACYKIIAGCSWIVSNPSSISGNIGTILVIEDSSALFESMGILFDCFTGEENTLKSTGHLPSLTDEQKQFLQDSINQASNDFKQFVLDNRPNVNPVVFKSGWYDGKQALSLGLIDEIGSESIAIQRAIELSHLSQETIL